MTNNKDVAKQRTREILSQSQQFASLSDKDKLEAYKDVYHNQLSILENPQGNGQLAEAKGLSTAMKASDEIDDSRHENRRIEQAGDLAADFINDVDFPEFVSDLLEGVFDANLNVTLKQMESYQELLKSATKSLTFFVKGVSNQQAFGYLADNMSDRFSLSLPDDGDAPQLANPQGEPVDLGDNEIKARIMDAKLALAKEQRALLRETILMGISRLVVEKGTVNAAVVFDVKAQEKIAKSDRAAEQSTTRSGKTGNENYWGRFWRPSRTTSSNTTKTSKISVSSAKSTATTDLAAKITGSVEIQFKSDYFKLDNFAAMYGGENLTNQKQQLPNQNQQLPPSQ